VTFSLPRRSRNQEKLARFALDRASDTVREPDRRTLAWVCASPPCAPVDERPMNQRNGHVTGNSILNVEPSASDRSRVRLPPCASAIQRAIGKPSPAPPLAPPARKNRSKMRD